MVEPDRMIDPFRFFTGFDFLTNLADELGEFEGAVLGPRVLARRQRSVPGLVFLARRSLSRAGGRNQDEGGGEGEMAHESAPCCRRRYARSADPDPQGDSA